METKKIILSEPLLVGGREITEIEVRQTTIGDEEDALQMAINMKRARNPMTTEMAQFSKATKLPFDAIRNLKTADYLKIRAALNELNGLSGKPEPDENPTMPSL